jgi:lipid II isoglutaminyl synthase (glutamine-hydrolysing)
MRYRLAILVGKLVRAILRLTGRGGTTLPGLLMLRLDPEILAQLSAKIKFGSVVVTGTNGKTTTGRLLSNILERCGYVVMANSAGSNLERGLVTAFLDFVEWGGQLEIDVAVLEVDEADLPNIIGKVCCRQLVVTNLFRDQLDRYGELLSIRRLIAKAIGELTTGAKLVLNADDPLVAALGANAPEGVAVSYFGLGINYQAPAEDVADSLSCGQCGGKLEYKTRFYSHLGDYRCTSCGWKRPALNIVLAEWQPQGLNGAELVVETKRWGQLALELKLPGLFNVYNLLAAVEVASNWEIEKDLLVEAVMNTRAAFGRMEKINFAGKELILALAKNPTGFNELIKTILQGEEKINLVFALNDNYADGRDVSWIWDINFEWLVGRLAWLALAGTRAEEALLRAKYAGIPRTVCGVSADWAELFNGLMSLPDGQRVYILATYTAMLDARQYLTDKGLVKGFWEEK